jgi:MFS family permease
VVAGRVIGRFGSRTVLAVGMSVQGLATFPLVFLGAGRGAVAVLIPALFTGFFGHVTSIVAYTVTATSGLPDQEQGLATGLTSMTNQVGITIGIPILSSAAATQSTELTGIHLALGVDVVVTLASMILVWFGLRPRGKPRAPAAAAGPGLTPERLCEPTPELADIGGTNERATVQVVRTRGTPRNQQ